MAPESKEERLVIHGGVPLRGTVRISGGKNSSVAVLPAALLCNEPCVIENLPDIEDVRVFCDMFRALGAAVELEGDVMRIDPRGVNTWVVPSHLARKMRASYYLMGALLGRFGKADVAFPGGCDLGARPMDQHMKGLMALGANISLEYGVYKCSCNKLTGAEIYLDVVSVGATINIMLAAARAEGTTVIVNAAKEPHVVDVASFLGAMGVKVKGAGTDTIRVEGRKFLKGCTYSVLPDQIETGTWMAIAAATQGDITIRNCVPYHMESVSAKLQEMGVRVIEGLDYLRVVAQDRPRAVQIKTLPYPGFPTDLQQPFTVLLSVAKGTSVVIENIYESRFRHIDEIRRMGAQIRVEDRVAVIEGVEELQGTLVEASDLRAGAALILAGLIAKGTTTITRLQHIDRGYEQIEAKLAALGADIQRIGG